MAQALQQNGYRFQSPMMNLGARPNVYKRSLEARENTNAYLADMERKAGGIDAEDERTAKDLYRAAGYALLILAGVGVAVAMVVM